MMSVSRAQTPGRQPPINLGLVDPPTVPPESLSGLLQPGKAILQGHVRWVRSLYSRVSATSPPFLNLSDWAWGEVSACLSFWFLSCSIASWDLASSAASGEGLVTLGCWPKAGRAGSWQRAREWPAPQPTWSPKEERRPGTGFGAQTSASVPSPHMPCSFQPQEWHTPPETGRERNDCCSCGPGEQAQNTPPGGAVPPRTPGYTWGNQSSATPGGLPALPASSPAPRGCFTSLPPTRHLPASNLALPRGPSLSLPLQAPLSHTHTYTYS